jgi:D-arabinose 1-dehydrogenase-like Zn-dependent alcohol dehydrogenase
VRVSPLGRRCAIGGTGPGKKVGIGGLGHMGLKLAKALGAHVVAFTFPH